MIRKCSKFINNPKNFIPKKTISRIKHIDLDDVISNMSESNDYYLVTNKCLAPENKCSDSVKQMLHDILYKQTGGSKGYGNSDGYKNKYLELKYLFYKNDIKIHVTY